MRSLYLISYRFNDFHRSRCALVCPGQRPYSSSESPAPYTSSDADVDRPVLARGRQPSPAAGTLAVLPNHAGNAAAVASAPRGEAVASSAWTSRAISVERSRILRARGW